MDLLRPPSMGDSCKRCKWRSPFLNIIAQGLKIHTVDRLSRGRPRAVCHQLWLERCSPSYPLGVQRGSDLLVHYLHRQCTTEAPARPAITTKPFLIGKVGGSNQRYLPGLPSCRLCFLVLPSETQRRRPDLARGLQLGDHHLLGHLRPCWHLLCTGWWEAIHCAGISGEGGVTRRKHPTCGSVALARFNVVMEIFEGTEDRVHCFNPGSL